MTIGTQVVEDLGTAVRYTNTSTDDDEVVIQTGDVGRYNAFTLMSVTGAVDVYPSIDGTNYAASALSLTDLGAADLTPVLVTSAGRIYGFRGPYAKIKVRQNGGTDVAVTLRCGNM